jgi:acetyl-CoA C-acetyltransferase
MSDVFLVQPVRTAVGKFQGALADVSAVELGRCVVQQTLQRAGLEPEAVDEVIMGNVLSAGLGQNIARQIAIKADVPNEKTAFSINMVCGSGLKAVALAAQAIKCGDADIVVAGGAENMTAAPYLLNKARGGYRLGNDDLVDSLVNDALTDVFNNIHMGVTAENVAQKYNITRQQQDEFAVASQNKAQAAIAAGKFADEIAAVSVPQRKGQPLIFDQDEFPRKNTTLESIAKLRPAFKKEGTVTAANSSGINDGAACVIVASSEAVRKYSLKPVARLVSYACHGTDPAIMGIGPVQAVKVSLEKAGWSLSDVQLIEANEAFAAQTLAVSMELKWNNDIVNVNGGAIALGHPIGASGARILVTLLHEMQRRKATKGLATLCVGGGMGVAACVELI